MKLLDWVLKPGNRLDLVSGISDGILTALTLAAGSVLSPSSSLDASLMIRVATAAGASGLFVLFVGHYALLRGELIEAERQLNLTSHGRLATSRLGRAVLVEAAQGALLAGIFSFCGALLPLAVAVLFPSFRWLSIAVALLALVILGILLGRVVHGSVIRWGIGLVAGGSALTYIGANLHIA